MAERDGDSGQEQVATASTPSDSQIMLSKLEALFEVAEATELESAANLLINERLSELLASSRPTELSLITAKAHAGFVHPESKVIRNYMVDALHPNDDEVYKVFLDTIGEFYQVSAWKERGIKQITFNAINRAVGKYFGNHYGTKNTEGMNQELYLDHTAADSDDINLSELKGKNLAVCAEKATVAQNLLTFMGIESTLIFSSNCRLTEGEPTTGHAYPIFRTEKGIFIYDPTNPIIALDTEEKVSSVYPAIYPINEEEYERLMSGGEVEVSHSDLKTVDGALVKDEPQKRIYAG